MAILVTGALVSGCERPRTAPPQIAPQDAAWSRIIHSHSAGVLSRKDKIRILFFGDVVAADRVGASAEQNLAASPSIAGRAVFALFKG